MWRKLDFECNFSKWGFYLFNWLKNDWRAQTVPVPVPEHARVREGSKAAAVELPRLQLLSSGTALERRQIVMLDHHITLQLMEFAWNYDTWKQFLRILVEENKIS